MIYVVLPVTQETFDEIADEIVARGQADRVEGTTMVRLTDVVLAGRWALLAEGTRYGRESGETVYLSDSATAERSLAENHRVFERALRSSPVSPTWPPLSA